MSWATAAARRRGQVARGGAQLGCGRKRGNGQVPPASWQPLRRHRRDAFSCLCLVDRQFLLSKGKFLSHFATADLENRQSWGQRPLATCSGDQGAKKEFGNHILPRRLRRCLNEVPDISHAILNDLKVGLRATGRWAHVGLMLLAYNVRCGPWGDGA